MDRPTARTNGPERQPLLDFRAINVKALYAGQIIDLRGGVVGIRTFDPGQQDLHARIIQRLILPEVSIIINGIPLGT